MKIGDIEMIEITTNGKTREEEAKVIGLEGDPTSPDKVHLRMKDGTILTIGKAGCA